MAYEGVAIFDPRLQSVLRLDAALERLCTGAVWSGGPVWVDRTETLVWSDIPNNRMLAWNESEGLSTFRLRSADDGIQVFDEAATLLGKILVPERTGNCVFGGPDRDTLDIAASTSLYPIRLSDHGARRPHA